VGLLTENSGERGGRTYPVHALQSELIRYSGHATGDPMMRVTESCGRGHDPKRARQWIRMPNNGFMLFIRKGQPASQGEATSLWHAIQVKENCLRATVYQSLPGGLFPFDRSYSSPLHWANITPTLL